MTSQIVLYIRQPVTLPFFAWLSSVTFLWICHVGRVFFVRILIVPHFLSLTDQTMGLLETYHYLMEVASDPRVRNWPLMNNPFMVISIVILYLLFVLRWGPSYMKNREPYTLTFIMFGYNIFLAVANATVLHGMLTSGYTTTLSLGCEPFIVSYSPERIRMTQWVWRLMLLKIIELGDTVIFVLRKKDNQVSFLHVYHHASTIIDMWIACKFAPGGMWTFVMMLNSFVHVVMYTYYLLASLGPKMQKRIASWKRYMTIIQLIQFILMIIHTSQAFLPSCEPNLKPLAVIYMTQVCAITYMFTGFYKKSYVKKRVE